MKDILAFDSVENTVLGGSTKVLVSSTDTDVFVLLAHYFESLSDQTITYGTYLALAIKQDTFLFMLWYRTLVNLKLQAY